MTSPLDQIVCCVAVSIDQRGSSPGPPLVIWYRFVGLFVELRVVVIWFFDNFSIIFKLVNLFMNRHAERSATVFVFKDYRILSHSKFNVSFNCKKERWRAFFHNRMRYCLLALIICLVSGYLTYKAVFACRKDSPRLWCRAENSKEQKGGTVCLFLF